MIDINNITVRYPGSADENPAISSFDLHLNSGEYIALLGANGSGKSTLIKALCGLIEIEKGEIIVDGKNVRAGRFGDDFFGIVAAVFQEPGGQFLMSTVEREIVAVLQNLGLTLEDQERRFKNVVKRFSLENILYRKPENLSGGQMQIVNLACAAAISPRVLLLDEPMTFLDTSYRESMLDMIDEFYRDGLTIMHVTQYPDEALRAGKAAIMDCGALIAVGEPESILGDEECLRRCRLVMPKRLLCKKKLGFDYADAGAMESHCLKIGYSNAALRTDSPEKIENGDLILKAINIGFAYPDGSFTLAIDRLNLCRGGVTGLIGPAGSGKSTLAFLLAGLLKPLSGEIIIDGLPLPKYENKKLREKVGISWQMPEAILVGPTVADDLWLIIDNLRLVDVDLKEILRRTNLAGYEDRMVDSLSGGEKRKVSLAGALVADPELIILDEPSAFLDPYSQIELIEIIKDSARAGKTILLIGHDLPFLAEVSDRIIGISGGRLMFDLPSLEFFNEPAYLEPLGLSAEPLIELRHRLVQKGIEMKNPSIDPAYLAGCLEPRAFK